MALVGNQSAIHAKAAIEDVASGAAEGSPPCAYRYQAYQYQTGHHAGAHRSPTMSQMVRKKSSQ